MVNTFLPYADYKNCAKVLDNKRLGKQRVEAKQIINIIENYDKVKAWKNHPAVLMWFDNVKSLKTYYNIMVLEWIRRGFNNTMPIYKIVGKYKDPWFIGNKSFHLSHQASLIRKNKSHYAKYFLHVPDDYMHYTYIWPSKLSKEQIAVLIKNKNKPLPIEYYSTKI